VGGFNANRPALFVLLTLAAWVVMFAWFNPAGWILAAVLAFMAMVAAPPLP
jgi:hypothetical protein